MIEAIKIKVGDTIEIEGRTYEALPEEVQNNCRGCDFIDVTIDHPECENYIYGCTLGNVIFKLKA